LIEAEKFEIIPSSKAGLMSKDSFLVVRGRTSYLRILGEMDRWELMTATASEDDGRVQVCGDRLRLIGAAMQLSKHLQLSPLDRQDWRGRDYVKVCSFGQGSPNDNLYALIDQTVKKFFEFFDNRTQGHTADMIDIYREISTDDDGDDVYLSDGLWLSSEGALKEGQ